MISQQLVASEILASLGFGVGGLWMNHIPRFQPRENVCWLNDDNIDS